MFRRCLALIAIFAMVCGFSTAPYTHVHNAVNSVADDHHPPGETLVHSHVAPHSHDHVPESGDEPADTAPDEDRIWSAATAMAHQSGVAQPHAPVVVEFTSVASVGEIQKLRIDRDGPRAHAPPLLRPPSLRAPPVLLPVSI